MFGEIVLSDERISRRIHTMDVANAGQHVIAIFAAFKTTNEGDGLAALHLDFGLRRGLRFLRLRAERAGACNGASDRDRGHTYRVQEKSLQRGGGAADGVEG